MTSFYLNLLRSTALSLTLTLTLILTLTLTLTPTLAQVIDSGIGIDEQSQKKLFGMFTKIKDARVRNPLGVGLGLAICKQLTLTLTPTLTLTARRRAWPSVNSSSS